MTLEQALSVDGIDAHVERFEDVIEFWWTADELPSGGVVDFRRYMSVAEATFDLERHEWTRFIVAPQAKGHGIFTAALSLPEDVCRHEGMWPQRIHITSPEIGFYRDAGFDPDPDDPDYVVKAQDRADAWLSR